MVYEVGSAVLPGGTVGLVVDRGVGRDGVVSFVTGVFANEVAAVAGEAVGSFPVGEFYG